METASASVREIHLSSSLKNKQFFHSSGRKHYPLKMSAIAISFLGKTVENAVTRKCQQHTTASFREASQSGFTPGHRIDAVFIATQATTNIEKSLMDPHRATCMGAISHRTLDTGRGDPALWYLQCLV